MSVFNKAFLKLAAVTIIGLVQLQFARAAVISYTKSAAGVTFKLNKGLMNVRVCKADIIEVTYTILDAFPQKNSLVINNTWQEKAVFTVSEHGGQIIITTARLKISINKTTNAIIYANKNGTVITAESAENKTMNAATIAGIDTYNCTTNFNSPADEALFGLGCHPEDSLSINYKGRNQEMLIKYMTGAIPVMLSNKGYGLLWDNYAASNFYGAGPCS